MNVNDKNGAVGILGVGVKLPETVRDNDWWPASVVEKWKGRAGKSSPVVHDRKPETAPDESVRLALEFMAKYNDDPFKGARSRRTRTTERPSELETLAAKEAVERSGVDPQTIDLVLVANTTPDHVGIPTAPLIHQALGLRRECISTNITAVCNGFFVEMGMAMPMIQTGAVRNALLVQSCFFTDLANQEDAFSPWLGDGATAVVVGKVGEGRGVLGMSHETDGALYDSMIIGSSQGPWYDAPYVRPSVYVENNEIGKQLSLKLPGFGRNVLQRAMERAGVTADQVSYLATHQGTAWLLDVTKKLVGFTNARGINTFEWTASVGPCNVPLCLALGEREGMLKAGDLVAAWGGGSGVTYSGMVMRWGA